MCRNHLSFTKDHLSLLLTLFGLLPPVIFGRSECDNKLVVYLLEQLYKVFHPFLQLVVVRADLNGHLKALKDYFLLAKGDFFQVTYESVFCPLLQFSWTTPMGAIYIIDFMTGRLVHVTSAFLQTLHTDHILCSVLGLVII
jgi:hypothetical protein